MFNSEYFWIQLLAQQGFFFFKITDIYWCFIIVGIVNIGIYSLNDLEQSEEYLLFRPLTSLLLSSHIIIPIHIYIALSSLQSTLLIVLTCEVLRPTSLWMRKNRQLESE